MSKHIAYQQIRGSCDHRMHWKVYIGSVCMAPTICIVTFQYVHMANLIPQILSRTITAQVLTKCYNSNNIINTEKY